MISAVQEYNLEIHHIKIDSLKKIFIFCSMFATLIFSFVY